MSSQGYARFTEPWSTTLLRTGLLALGIAAAVALLRHSAVAGLVTLAAALWFTLGGHFVELLFRNRLGVLLGHAARLVRPFYWFAAGVVLYTGALLTRAALTGQRVAPWPWWWAGCGFVAAELLVHMVMHLRKLPSYYDGQG